MRRQFRGHLWPLFLLWIPVPFYSLSVAYSGVPIYVPAWWPFSYYNVRYGLELLPAFAVFGAVAVYFAAQLVERRAFRFGAVAAILIFVASSYASIWRAPACFSEAAINSRGRIAVERELADFIKALPPDSTMLMYLGNHVGALQQAGVPLRRVINEGNHRTWKQPADLDGLWERALANPGSMRASSSPSMATIKPATSPAIFPHCLIASFNKTSLRRISLASEVFTSICG